MNYLKIKSIKKINRLDRYDLTVNTTHNFFANNILIHNTSFVSSKILCKKPLTWSEKILKKLKVNIVDTHYDYVYSSRKVIKNVELTTDPIHYYNTDIWGKAHDVVKHNLLDGMTMYGEIVGFTPEGGAIQKDYDYGYIPNPDLPKEGERLPFPKSTFGVYIYRITQTNNSGKVFEFSGKQVQDFCKKNGLNPVPELYYGRAKELLGKNWTYYSNPDETFEDWILRSLKEKYNEKNCYICLNKVPEEGIVVRIEGLDIEAYKVKSNAFYARETAQLDKGEVDIESQDDVE